MNDILYSIIVPTFNSAAFIAKCLQSLVDQVYSNWEAIVIDNSSIDNTIEIVNSFGDSRIKLCSINNEGIIAKSRNLGLDVAVGDWICFLDSDDWWCNHKLLVCNKYSFCSTAFLYHDLRLVRNKYRLLQRDVMKSRSLHENRLFDLLSGENPIKTSSVCFSKSILGENRFNESPMLVGVEDFDFWIRLLLNEKVKPIYIRKTLGFYLLGHNFSSNRKQLDQERHLYSLYIDMFSRKERREILKLLFYHKGCYLYNHFLFCKAMKYFKTSCTSTIINVRLKSIYAAFKCILFNLYNLLK